MLHVWGRAVARRMIWLALTILLSLGAGTNVGEARPESPPDAVTVLGLEPESAGTAVLSWQRIRGVRYRLCYSTDYRFSGFVHCFMVSGTASWSVGVPADHGGAFYFTVQACHSHECSEPARAGAVGRGRGDGVDFYATAFLRPDGQVTLAAFLREAATALRYYRTAPGAAGMLDSVCPPLTGGAVCGKASLVPPGSLTGVAALGASGVEVDVTLQVRDTPTIAFMFDDGAGIVSGGVYRMQQVLDSYGVTGNFFLTGLAMQTYPSAVRALVAGGHRVGSHTWGHPYLTRLNDAAITGELDRTEAQFRAIIPGGVLRPCFRAPYGDFNARVLRMVQARGYQQYTQTVNSNDWTGAQPAQIVQNVLAGARDGASVSFHTQERHTVTALATLVPALLAQGYRFVHVC